MNDFPLPSADHTSFNNMSMKRMHDLGEEGWTTKFSKLMNNKDDTMKKLSAKFLRITTKFWHFFKFFIEIIIFSFKSQWGQRSTPSPKMTTLKSQLDSILLIVSHIPNIFNFCLNNIDILLNLKAGKSNTCT